MRASAPRAFLLCLLGIAPLCVAVGCASDSRDYAYEPPPEEVESWPARGMTLAQTVAGLHVRDTEDVITVQKLDVFDIAREPWKRLSRSEAAAIDTPEPGRTFAVVANRHCRAKIATEGGQWVGQSIDWFLLPDGRLEAWDAERYHFKCASSTEFFPAVGDRVPLEQAVIAHAGEYFPTSRHQRGHTYAKGVMLARVGRIEEAEAMLARGDSLMDQSATPQKILRRQGGKGIGVARESDIDNVRAMLIETIEDAKAGYRMPIPPIDAAVGREALREEAARNDAAQRKRWEDARAGRLYVQEKGSWRVVTDLERRKGPGPDDDWVGFEEMQRRKQEATAARVSSPAPEKKAAKAAQKVTRPTSAPAPPELFVKRDGQWVGVDAAMRAEGPRDGEAWVDRQQMELMRLEEQLEQAGYE